MGQLILEKVVKLLSNGGIRTENAYPAERITRITSPVAAVSLGEVDQEKDAVTVLVEIFGPKASGGYACQQKALEAGEILAGAGAVCRQGGCDFISKGNVFRVQVEAHFNGKKQMTITTGELTLPYACSFSSEQVLDETVTSLYNAPWEFTVEEFFPWGVWNSLEAQEPFTLDLHVSGNIERFEKCVWTERKRITEQLGIRQIRKGKATGRTLTSE